MNKNAIQTWFDVNTQQRRKKHAIGRKIKSPKSKPIISQHKIIRAKFSIPAIPMQQKRWTKTNHSYVISYLIIILVSLHIKFVNYQEYLVNVSDKLQQTENVLKMNKTHL